MWRSLLRTFGSWKMPNLVKDPMARNVIIFAWWVFGTKACTLRIPFDWFQSNGLVLNIIKQGLHVARGAPFRLRSSIFWPNSSMRAIMVEIHLWVFYFKLHVKSQADCPFIYPWPLAQMQYNGRIQFQWSNGDSCYRVGVPNEERET